MSHSETTSHTGRELELMLAGTKPLSMFYAEVGELPNEELIPEKNFSPYVERGEIVRGELVIPLHDHPKLRRHSAVKYIFYALKQEAWRIEAITLLKQSSNKSGWSETCERMEGSLLGYTEEENDAHCKSLFGKQTA